MHKEYNQIMTTIDAIKKNNDAIDNDIFNLDKQDYYDEQKHICLLRNRGNNYKKMYDLLNQFCRDKIIIKP